ncbi:MAG: 50S ribosomal protein L10 [Candidatus Poribacteria bacterium]|nr:50S ribosomal protein L10 [Candidatus Poribacteria bacterium]
MPNEANIQQVGQIRELFESSDVILLADFQGLTVAEVNDLRQQLREANVQYKVFKNTLINVVAQEREIEELAEYLKGNTALAASDDPAASSKILFEFSEEHESLKIKGGILGTQVVDADGVKALQDMPSKEVLIGKAIGGIGAPLYGLVGVLKNGSPITGFVNVLSNTIGQVTSVLTQIAEQKKAAE